MVNKELDKILKGLEKLKRTEERLRYLDEVLKLKSLEDRSEVLKEIIKRTSDDELKKELNVLVTELESPEEVKEEPTRIKEFAIEELEERKEETKSNRLEDTVEKEKIAEGNKTEYFIPTTAFYQSTITETTPLLSNIKRDLIREGIISEGSFVSDEQKSVIRERIEKYLPNSNPERINNYVNLIGGSGSQKYENNIPSLKIRELLGEEKPKGLKYKSNII